MVSVKHFFFVLLLLAAAPSWATVTARVDRTEIYDDESLLLTVSVSPIGDIDKNDLNALQTLFDIVQRGSSTSHNIVNGRSSSQADFQFRLRPKQIGNLAIPNFHSGNSQSQPIFISVLDSSQRKDGLPDDTVTLSATLDETNPYVDQPVFLTIELVTKISFAQGAELSSIDAPEFDIENIDSQSFQRNVGNQSATVYKNIYKLTPKKPGAYKLPNVRLSAQYPNRRLNRYMPISRSAEIAPIEVKPVPSSFPAGAYWLPAKNLALTDNLKTPLNVKANEHLEWKITATTAGLDARRLPDLFNSIEPALNSSIKSYKNNPEFSENQRTDSTALVFTQAGNVSLPQVKIPWWNVTTDQLEWATLPAYNVQVAQGNLPQTVAPAQIESNTATPVETSATNPVASAGSNPLWKITTAVFAFLWLATIAYVVYLRRSIALHPTSSPTPTPRKKKTAMNFDQPSHVYQQVIERLAINNSRAQLTQEDSEVLIRLEQALFKSGEVPEKAQLKALLKAAEKLSKTKADESSSAEFQLY